MEFGNSNSDGRVKRNQLIRAQRKMICIKRSNCDSSHTRIEAPGRHFCPRTRDLKNRRPILDPNSTWGAYSSAKTKSGRGCG